MCTTNRGQKRISTNRQPTLTAMKPYKYKGSSIKLHTIPTKSTHLFPNPPPHSIMNFLDKQLKKGREEAKKAWAANHAPAGEHIYTSNAYGNGAAPPKGYPSGPPTPAPPTAPYPGHQSNPYAPAPPPPTEPYPGNQPNPYAPSHQYGKHSAAPSYNEMTPPPPHAHAYPIQAGHGGWGHGASMPRPPPPPSEPYPGDMGGSYASHGAHPPPPPPPPDAAYPGGHSNGHGKQSLQDKLLSKLNDPKLQAKAEKLLNQQAVKKFLGKGGGSHHY